MKKTFLFFLCLFLGNTSFAQADLWDSTKESLGKAGDFLAEEFRDGRDALYEAAKNGSAVAQLAYAKLLEKTKETAADAVDWYKKASAQGVVEAKYRLGRCYEDGIGVSEDVEKAVSYYVEAADGGDADAMYRLGCIYRDGKGNVQKDTAKALYWLDKSAAKGNKEAKSAFDELKKSLLAPAPADKGILI